MVWGACLEGLTYGAFQRDGEKLLRFDSELHRELIHDFLGVAIDDEADSLLDSDTTLLTVEDLIFADLARGGFVLDDGSVIVYMDVGEGMSATAIREQKAIALRMVASVLCIRTSID